MGSALDADVGVEAVERGEEVGVEQQFPFPGHRPLHRGAQRLLVLRVVGAAGERYPEDVDGSCRKLADHSEGDRERTPLSGCSN